MDASTIAEKLRSWALEEGFDAAGIATLEPSRHGAAFRRWLDRGDHADMAWIARRVEVRLQPGAMLEGARSALCVAMAYHPLEGEEAPSGALWPGVARYARGRDYHEVMLERLQRLEARIRESFPDSRTRRYVDTGPVLERELAARAGLGAIGKNTLLLNPELGSWFLLGEVFLTLELPPGQPLADLCGSCSRCLDACPTGALPEPYRLDSRRCLSYWTIEHRGAFPAAVSGWMEEWVFGCDACQEACPWNAGPLGGDHPELGLPAERRDLDLDDLIGLSTEEWRDRFRKSPLKRTQLEGMQRNAAAVLGHRGPAGDLEALAGALGSEASSVRLEAVRALGRIGGEKARSLLLEHRAREGVQEVSEALEKALPLG